MRPAGGEPVASPRRGTTMKGVYIGRGDADGAVGGGATSR
jgi:hypothetical protein